MSRYDGSQRWADTEHRLAQDGYVQRFCCRPSETIPDDFDYTGLETGWDMRRKIKKWCADHRLTDILILRNTSYHRDLVGPVYELWVRS